MKIVGITVSVDLGEKEYGNGQEHFVNMTAKEEPGIPLEDIDQVVDQGLDLFFGCWKTLLSGRYVTGRMKGEEFLAAVDRAAKRVKNAHNLFQKDQTSE